MNASKYIKNINACTESKGEMKMKLSTDQKHLNHHLDLLTWGHITVMNRDLRECT